MEGGATRTRTSYKLRGGGKGQPTLSPYVSWSCLSRQTSPIEPRDTQRLRNQGTRPKFVLNSVFRVSLLCFPPEVCLSVLVWSWILIVWSGRARLASS